MAPKRKKQTSRGLKQDRLNFAGSRIANLAKSQEDVPRGRRGEVGRRQPQTHGVAIVSQGRGE